MKQLASIYAYDNWHWSTKYKNDYYGGWKNMRSIYIDLEDRTPLGVRETDWIVTDLTGYGLLEWDRSED